MLKEPATAERAGFIENVRNVAAVDDRICVGDTLLREISCYISIMYSDRYLKSPNKVAAGFCSANVQKEQGETRKEGHNMHAVYQS